MHSSIYIELRDMLLYAIIIKLCFKSTESTSSLISLWIRIQNSDQWEWEFHPRIPISDSEGEFHSKILISQSEWEFHSRVTVNPHLHSMFHLIDTKDKKIWFGHVYRNHSCNYHVGSLIFPCDLAPSPHSNLSSRCWNQWELMGNLSFIQCKKLSILR